MKTGSAISALLSLAAVLSMPAACQSLGDVVKKQQASTSKKAKVVLTDDDIVPSREASSSPASQGESNTDVKNSENAKAAAVDSPRQSTPERVATLKAKVNELTSKQSEYEISIAQLEKKLELTDNDFRTETYRAALENNRRSLKIVTQQRETAEKELADLQDKAKSTNNNAATN